MFDNKNLNLLQALLVPFSLTHPVKEGKSWTVSFVIHILPNGNLSDWFVFQSRQYCDDFQISFNLVDHTQSKFKNLIRITSQNYIKTIHS